VFHLDFFAEAFFFVFAADLLFPFTALFAGTVVLKIGVETVIESVI
jgi:hypothetical protein